MPVHAVKQMTMSFDQNIFERGKGRKEKKTKIDNNPPTEISF